MVTAIAGPDGDEPAQFGEVVSWAVTADAQTDAATQFVTYMMEDGYEQWIGFAPEGKVPARQGTADEPTRFVDAWATMPAGVDTRAPLSDFYAPEVLEAVHSTIRRHKVTYDEYNEHGDHLLVGDPPGAGRPRRGRPR